MGHTFFTRRAVVGNSLAAVALSTAPPGLANEPPHDVTYIEDFDELWRTLDERYCFFSEKSTDWNRVRALYRPLAMAADSDVAFTNVVRLVLVELYDAHTHLSDPSDGSPRWPMYDLMVERVGHSVRIAAVQDGSAASAAKLVIGDTIVTVDGIPIERVARDLMPRCLVRPDPAADAYALNVAVAGRVGQGRRFTIQSVNAPARDVLLPVGKQVEVPDVEYRRLAGGFGYIVIRSFGDSKVADAFDHALAELQDAPGLIIDVRDNGGGDTAVAKPIMGRFIAAPKPYAIMRRREGTGLSAPWTEIVDPNGPFTYTRPVVVLTSHWSGSMAEGFPMGMRGIGRATIVGTPMMGLGAAVFPIRLDRTGIQAQYSGEPVYDTHDRPRWLMRPDVAVRDGDDILAAGIVTLKRLLTL